MLRRAVTFSSLLLLNSLLCQGAVVFYLEPRTSLGPKDLNDPLCQIPTKGVCGTLFGVRRNDIADPGSALTALASPPPPSQTGRLLASGVLRGTKVVGLRTEGDTTIVSFS